MYQSRSHRVYDRIVSIAQPDVRPIVRGKAKANVEFGPKVAISVVDGYSLMEKTAATALAVGSMSLWVAHFFTPAAVYVFFTRNTRIYTSF